MAFIEWRADYNLDIDELDAQHRRLAEVVNRFDEAVRHGRGSRVMDEILNELIGYTQEHFAYEEKFMEEAGYSGLKRHKAQHRQLLQKVERLQYDFGQGSRRITTEVRDLLRYWLMNHILKNDVEFAAELKQGAGAPEK